MPGHFGWNELETSRHRRERNLMNALHPIIRRVRRPLLPPDDLPVVPPEPVAPVPLVSELPTVPEAPALSREDADSKGAQRKRR
jgi:hypothetical protein